MQQPSFDPASVNEEPSSSLDKKTEGPEKGDENLEAIFETPTDKPPASAPSASPKKKQTSPLRTFEIYTVVRKRRQLPANSNGIFPPSNKELTYDKQISRFF